MYIEHLVDSSLRVIVESITTATRTTSRNNARTCYSYNDADVDHDSECRTSIEKKELNPVQKEIIRKYKTPPNMDTVSHYPLKFCPF